MPHDHTHGHGHDCRCDGPNAGLSVSAPGNGHGHAHAHDHAPGPLLGHLDQADIFPCCCGAGCGDSAAKPQAPADLPPGKSVDVFRIEAMDCPTEERLIRKALEPMAGVKGLAFNLLGRELTVSHDLPATDAITAAIAALGMEAVPVDKRRPAGPESAPVWMTPKLAVSLALAVAAELLEWRDVASPWLPAACAIAAIALSGLPVFKKGWLAVLRRDLNINALMSVAAAGALLLGQFPEAAMVMALFAVAEKLEAASLTRAKNAVAALLALAPQEATVIGDDGSEAVVAAGAVPIGARIRLRPGERVPLDGAVEAGRSALDQSAVTGESLPVEKGPGDQLFAGTVNQEGELIYRTTALADDSTLARITRAVVASPGKKARTERFVDRFAAVYTPAVFAVALAVAVLPPLVAGASFTDWIYKGLVILVIACPCALVISTPVSMVSGLAAAARRGILVKGGLFLEQGHALTTMVLDKTGTLTTGKPSATETFDLAGDAAANRAVAVSLAARSDHPVSKALARAGREDGVAALPVADFAALPGRGVRGVVDGVPYHLGNHRLIEELGLCGPAIEARLETLEAQGQTAALLAGPDMVLAIYAAADVIKPHSREAVAELHSLGIRTVLLSGDNSRTAAVIAGQAGIDEARGDQLPEDKAAAVDALTAKGDGSGLVGMVGDGINDAPALARADIGFAMAAAGTDAAIETADVAIMDDDLRKVAAFVRLSRATVSTLKQNIALALGLKGLVLALTLLGYGSMLLAVFADMGTSLLVIANGLRLLRK
ncbi:heavy metal translocating P-type ATPase [Solidesulfovibrio magneticus]|uniref:P-type Zn(2+) transporter n=1 Tax=Solidesulfovibrio magneticus (strain ATCC 700980 / DSM 13731 / RS-1) TaxID=573370 RepID=C4XMH5_SOLM1|nr:heavy metal translocating P-type ATPase [Solidesulfovibrio magneticus]BAH74766.1 putative cation translocating P-type ATPase [Solidesulfovibrio magneticus RS-1]